eukprot:4817460-Amphidinium_carterae.1
MSACPIPRAPSASRAPPQVAHGAAAPTTEATPASNPTVASSSYPDVHSAQQAPNSDGAPSAQAAQK